MIDLLVSYDLLLCYLVFLDNLVSFVSSLNFWSVIFYLKITRPIFYLFFSISNQKAPHIFIII